MINSDLPNQIIAAIRSVVGSGNVALHEPSFSGNEWIYLKECLDSTFVSSVGKFVDQFESELTAFTGAKYAIAVVNGTAALHIALKLAGVIQEDEVLVPALTFIATANAVAYCGATPHFVDSEESALGINTEKLRRYLEINTEIINSLCVNKNTGKVIRAIVPMHTFGHPSDIEGLLRISKDFNLALVEDAAESIGSYYKGQHTGTFGLLGTLSFNGNKSITTGGGGAILTNDRNLAFRAKHITTTAKISHKWEYRHDEIGFNYRLPNINAALGCAQLEQLPLMLDRKLKLFKSYQHAFSKINGVSLVKEPQKCKSNYWLQTLVLREPNRVLLNEILARTNEDGLMTRPVWELLSDLPIYMSSPRMDLTGSLQLSNSLINIPSSADIGLK